MAEEIKDPVANPAKTGEEEGNAKTLTLEEVTAQISEIKSENEKIKKQNSDKDSFISKVTGENKELRDTLQKLSSALQGKSEKQRDAIVESQRQKFLDKGYDVEAADLIIDTVGIMADSIANKKVASIIMDTTEDLIESDPDIDKKFMENNFEYVKSEFDNYKSESSPRKIKANLKKAYNVVKERLAKKEKSKGEKEEENREKNIQGGSPAPQGGRKDTTEEDFIKGIVNAGNPNSHFI